jgi:DNA-binding response OmpR family regulator
MKMAQHREKHRQQRSSNKSMKRRSDKFILLVTDDSHLGSYLVHCLRKRTSYWVHRVTDTTRAFRFCLSLKPDLVVLDLALPDESSLDLYEHLHAHDEFQQLPVILLRTRSPHLAAETKRQQRAALDLLLEPLLPTLAELLI